MATFADLNGRERIRLDSSLPALRHCRWCGSEWGYKTSPVGPHHDGVRCDNCNRHLGWLPDTSTEDFSLIED